MAIRIPGTFAGKPFYFEKVRDRQVWDFALVNIASAMSTRPATPSATPAWSSTASRRGRCAWLEAVEAFVARQGAQRGDGRAWPAEIATRGAVPLRHNAYKVPLMQNLVKRAIRGEGEWTS